MQRRDFLKTSLATTATLPMFGSNAFGQTEDHFLIHYIVSGGMDSHYWFDPKSKSLTQENLKQNYLAGTDDQLMLPIQDARGMKSFCTPMVKKLWDNHKDAFSVLKGLYMSSSSDGHENNLTMLLTGKAIATPTYLPNIRGSASLDFVQHGIDKDLVTNMGGGSNLSPNLIANLQRTVNNMAAAQGDLGSEYIDQRLKRKGDGLISAGARLLQAGLGERSRITKMIKAFDTSDYAKHAKESAPVQFFPLLRDAFRSQLTRTAIVRDGGLVELDAHNVVVAKQLPKTIYPPIVENVDRMFKFLKATDFDATRKLIDVCTVVVSTEFNRTYRSLVVGGADVTDTGTDHNTFGSFCLVGGKGFKHGLICGSTDLDEAKDGKFINVSGPHEAKDPYLVKACGLPFDRDNLVSKPFPKEGEFRKSEHLHFNSVSNSILSMFGRKDRQTIEGTSIEAPVLHKLLS